MPWCFRWLLKSSPNVNKQVWIEDYYNYYFCSHSLQNMNRAYMNIKIYTFEYLKLRWSSSHELAAAPDLQPDVWIKTHAKMFLWRRVGCRPCPDNGWGLIGDGPTNTCGSAVDTNSFGNIDDWNVLTINLKFELKFGSTKNTVSP